VERGLVPLIGREFRADSLDHICDFLVVTFLVKDSFLVHGTKAFFERIEELSSVHAFAHLGRFYLASTIDAAAWASHQLNILVVALLSLELSDDVLDVLEAVRCHELYRQVPVRHFLVVPVFALLVIKWRLDRDGVSVDLTRHSSINVLQVPI